MVKIDPITMGDILEPFEKQFKKFTAGQKEIWYDKLCLLDRKYLEKAIGFLVEKNRTMPTIQEVKSAYWEARASDREQLNTQVEGCAHCKHGWVKFTIWGNTEHTRHRLHEFTCPCAYCLPDYNLPQVIKRDDKIFWACEKVSDNKYKADLKHLELIDDARPGKISDRRD